MALRLDDVDLVRDRALVEMFQAGDQAGFEDLYRRYYGRLYRFCLKRVGDPHDAEEVTQESFARAFRALSSFGGERRFYPWLSVIAARLCVDNHRRRARTEPSADIDPGITEPGQDRVLDEVDRELLAKALARLAPRHREVLRLREEEGWSYQHIASHYDVSLGTVEALLWRARRALKREFIAVSGVESRGDLAAIPVLGWLARRLHNARVRVGHWTDSALPALANGAVSMAIVVGSSAGATALVHSIAAGPARNSVQVVATAATSTVNSDLVPASTTAAPSIQAGAATSQSAAGPSHDKSEVRHVGTVTVASGSTAQQDYSAMPYRIDVAGTGVGINPAEAVQEIQSVVLQLTGGGSK